MTTRRQARTHAENLVRDLVWGLVVVGMIIGGLLVAAIGLVVWWLV